LILSVAVYNFNRGRHHMLPVHLRKTNVASPQHAVHAPPHQSSVRAGASMRCEDASTKSTQLPRRISAPAGRESSAGPAPAVWSATRRSAVPLAVGSDAVPSTGRTLTCACQQGVVRFSPGGRCALEVAASHCCYMLNTLNMHNRAAQLSRAESAWPRAWPPRLEGERRQVGAEWVRLVARVRQQQEHVR